MTCASCNAAARDGDRFCAQCGAPIASLRPVEPLKRSDADQARSFRAQIETK